MTIRATIFICTAALALGTAIPAGAQDAAESAIILGGSAAAQAKGQRTLGAAVAGSMGRAANAIAATNARAFPGSTRASPGSRNAARGTVRQMIMLPGKVDPLEFTDAAKYKLTNGASIRVSGTMRPTSQAICQDNCSGGGKRSEVGR